MRITSISAIIALFFLAPSSAFAHSGLPSLEAVSGPYLIDIGFDQQLIAKQEILFDFALIENPDSADWTLAPFDALDILIMSGKQELLAKTVKREDFGKTFITYTFPHTGEYMLSATFQKDKKIIASASFPLVVTNLDGSVAKSFVSSVWMMLGMLIVFCVGIAVFAGRRFNRRPQSAPSVTAVTSPLS